MISKPDERNKMSQDDQQAADVDKVKDSTGSAAASLIRKADPVVQSLKKDNPDAYDYLTRAKKGSSIFTGSRYDDGKLQEANKPTKPELWSRAKSLARQKFDVYPSAYANGWAAKWYKSKGGGWRTSKQEQTYHIVKQIIKENVYEDFDLIDEAKSPAWQRKEGKNPEGGLNRKGIESYRRENPGSKLSMAVTTKPSKLKKGSKAANRRKSFCARMKGMKRRLTSAKTANDPDSRINKSLRKWNC